MMMTGRISRVLLTKVWTEKSAGEVVFNGIYTMETLERLEVKSVHLFYFKRKRNIKKVLIWNFRKLSITKGFLSYIYITEREWKNILKSKNLYTNITEHLTSSDINYSNRASSSLLSSDLTSSWQNGRPVT